MNVDLNLERCVELAEKRWEEAAQLLRDADALLSDLGSALEPADIVERDRITATIRNAVGETRFETLLRERANHSTQITITASLLE